MNHQQVKQAAPIVFTVLCLLALGGCATAGLSLGKLDLAKDSKLQTVSGIVKLGEVLVNDSLVTFTPEEFPSEKNVFFVAQSDAEGKYLIKFKWSRYRHYTLKAVYTDEGDLDDTGDDKVYTGAVHIDPIEYQPLKKDINLVLQSTPPSSTFIITGVVKGLEPDPASPGNTLPVPDALVMVQPALASGETLQSYLDHTGPDGTYRISVPWYYERRYQIIVVWPADARPDEGEQLLVGSKWLGTFSTLPLTDVLQDIQLAAAVD